MPDSRPDGRPTLTKAQRQILLDRALEAIAENKDLLADARRQNDAARGVAAASRELLARADPSIGATVRLHLQSVADIDRLLVDAPLAVVGSQHARPRSFVDEVLEARFGNVAHVDGGARVIAHIVVSQPLVVVLRDDLVRPSPVEVALLARSLAPATVVLVISDDPVIFDDARRVAVRTCSEIAGADELGRALDRVLA